MLKCIDSEHGGGLNDSVWLTNSHLVTACDDGMVRVWDVETVSHKHTPQLSYTPYVCLLSV
ncbi:hypothetical protein EON63_01215 [archaeon]|nr:MAG: hypothetical protein EON63_01215 [archaeon]